ncbi:MAG: isoleucine--tRNA ligase [Candidatus Micrarchaeaceae archaeon]
MLDLNKNEEEILGYWKEHEILKIIREKNRGRKPFYFLDGPPYVTGQLGAHHVWVETIKDLVLRYKRYRRFDVHDRAGFDVHGLPIEVKVEKKLGITSKADIEDRMGIEAFINACREFAKEQAKGMISDYTRFGSSLDFEHAYVPYEHYYINAGWGIFKKMYEKGLIYKDVQGLAYCPKDETVLSAQGPEVEYADATDPSIFVAFRTAGHGKASLPVNSYLVIWTTTPWTLPSNLAIAANPEQMYVIAKCGDKNYIVAKERLDAFTAAIGTDAIVTAEMHGRELKDVKYISPLEGEVPRQKELRKYHKVLLSETFVTVTEGTGLLHVAPGHGPEDFKLGRENKMPIMSPIDNHARYTDEAGKFSGLKVPEEANKAVLEVLKANGSLLHQGSITHSYPHCWRCESKLIYRATEQWFVNIRRIKRKMLKENAKIKWHPEAARDWFAEATENSPDWTISRQRYWGSTIPVWVCESCGEIEVIGSSKELEERSGLKEPLTDLHKSSIDKVTFKCKKCDGAAKRIPDIFDVWYDAGISHTASLSDAEFKRFYPADWITESRDQIRGWFAVLLRTSVAIYGKTSYKRVNIGGMIKDELGQEMHRHLGNAVSAKDLLSLVSADGFRFWCSSHPRWLELKLKKQELLEANSNIITFYNIAELVREFNSFAKIKQGRVRRPIAAKLETEERWILSRFSTLVDSMTKNLDNYFIDDAVKVLRDFVLEDFSRFYLRIAKKKVSSGNKKQARTIADLVNYIFHNTLIISSIIMPFSSEKMHIELYGGDTSVFMEKWPKADTKSMDKQLESEFGVARGAMTAILNSREKSGTKLRWPIAMATVEVSGDDAYSALRKLSYLIENYTNVKHLEIRKTKASAFEVRPLFQKLGPEFKENASAVADALKKADAQEMLAGIDAKGSYQLRTERGLFNVTKSHFGIIEKLERENAIKFEYGIAYADTEVSKELLEEAMLREFERRVQIARKDMGLKKGDRIALSYTVSKEIHEILDKYKEQLSKDLSAVRISSLEKVSSSFVKEFSIDEENVVIGIDRA